jgi:hypothetical protein
MAQASGIYGIGLLADFKGNDIHHMELMGQGFGVFGVGLLLDSGRYATQNDWKVLFHCKKR